ncbi:hypothetical protein [Nitrospira sp. Nam80]
MTAPGRRLTGSLLMLGLAGAVGCGHEATLVRDTGDGGLVSYAYQTEAEVFASSGRRDAFRLIGDKCPAGSRIVREGQIPKVSAAADRIWRGQIGTDRLWGIQFACE